MPDPLAASPRTGFIDWVTRPRRALATIWLLGLLAFLPTLWGPWLLDDAYIRDSIDAVHAGGLGALADDGWKTHLFLGNTGIGRPLAMATFAGNALISADPFGFKAVNLVLHLVTATLAYLLVRVLMGTRYEPGTADRAALVVALLWTLHPLQISTVGYVVQRMTILSVSALFSVWALLLYARLRVAGRGGAGSWPRRCPCVSCRGSRSCPRRTASSFRSYSSLWRRPCSNSKTRDAAAARWQPTSAWLSVC